MGRAIAAGFFAAILLAGCAGERQQYVRDGKPYGVTEGVFIDPTLPKQEYLPSLRAGVFCDPEPSSGRKSRWFGLDRGNGAPDDYYGISFGVGALIKDRVNIDFACVFRWGDDVRVDAFARTPAAWGTRADVRQHQLFLSTVVYL